VTVSPGEGAPLLQVQELRVHFFRGRSVDTSRRTVPDGALAAVNGVSFSVDRGSTVGLVGESGSGKSTVARAVLGLLPWSSGSVSYAGQPLDRMNRRELRALRRRAQIVFQDPAKSLNPRLSVGRAVGEVLGVVTGASGSERRARAESLLDRVGLASSVYRALPHQLSGGQRQRACIARALAVNPEFLVLDEPLSALDVSVQAHIVNLLHSLQKELGLTYLFISHDLGVVQLLSDSVVIMRAGSVVEAGPSAALMTSPAHPYTRRLLEAASLKPVRGRRGPG